MSGYTKLMKPDEGRSAASRWLNKAVLESVQLDDATDEGSWRLVEQGEMTLVGELAGHGRRAVRMTSPTTSDKSYQTEAPGRPHGKCSVLRKIPGESWESYNRVAFKVYPMLPGFRTISMSVVLHNEGGRPIPDKYLREGIHYFLLKPDCWNEVVWEIAHLPRDRVTGLEFVYRLQGSDEGAARTVSYDIGDVRLQKVEADYYEGWGVAPGRMAYSHSGYTPLSEKKAFLRDNGGEVFRLIDAATEKTVLSGPVRTEASAIGTFSVLDFSAWTEPGTYLLEAGPCRSEPFPIGRQVWEPSIRKTLNFFSGLRCGEEVPGIHGECHRDFLCEHEGKRIVINGGWHDAGDLSQGAVNTAEAVYAMLKLAASVKAEQPELFAQLRQEARWGLKWLLKTRFGDGYRTTWATMDLWTDGILGTEDDEICQAGNDPLANYAAAAAEALATREWERDDPIFAAQCLQAAGEDWAFANAQLDAGGVEDDHYVAPLTVAAQGILASTELYRLTGEEAYRERAIALADDVTGCQQRTLPDWPVPLRGFFYTSSSRTKLLHYSHRGHEQAPVVGLAELLTLFPEHENWGRWYSAIALHSEYLARMSEFTRPYGMLPAGIYDREESDDPDYQEQVQHGIALSDRYSLRLFPVWFGMRGNSGTVLSQTKALTVAAKVRGSRSLLNLARRQLEWTVGANPFAQSLMYGEGYDYAPQYTAVSGDLCGSLPVGVQTRENYDIPYWPMQNCYNYKEVWVHPSSRWLWLMEDLYGAEAGETSARSDSGAGPSSANRATELSITAEPCEEGIRIYMTGTNAQCYRLRTSNLAWVGSELLEAETELCSFGRASVICSVIDTEEPWFLVVLDTSSGRSWEYAGN
ncbi:glycoside hydrolase family 9 protein [Cohnella boryungensis]|uniref:Glycoside hydrolase family 9 protein n=1 Tax=Cohnella boryungensis TaxID=768479 RepID=A0ABV8S5E0_9BACL